MSEVKAVRLVSGEEVLCQIQGEDTNKGVYFVSAPRVLQLMPTPQGGYGLGLLPWFHSKSSGEIEMSKSHIVAICDPDADTEKAYLEQVSGIKLATPGNILHG